MDPEPQSIAGAVEVVFSDDAIIVLNKPTGLLAVPGRGADKQDCLSSRVQRFYGNALIVHRLDMSTSGLLVMARGPAAQRVLNRAFAERQVHKRYVAVVIGAMVAQENRSWETIDLPILVDWPNRPLRKIDMQEGQASVTRWRNTEYDAVRGTSRVELEPVTGRSHQLRVHLQAIGHPILGDALYAPPQVCAMASRLLLHACELAFTHPVDGQSMRFECSPDF